MLASVAISRDWVPALYGTEAEPLSRVNSQLARLDLAAEVVGPIGAGVLFGLLSEQVYPSLFVLGLLRILCLVAQTAFFINILQRYPALDWRAGLEPASKQRDSPNILTAWRTFLQHPGRVQLIVFSYAMVYLTVLSPHGLLLTAYLSTESLSASVLSVFRGCGALVGIVGVTMFQLAVKACGLPKATLGFIGFQALCSILAAAVFQLSHGQHLALHAFMFLVVLARFGLYGFEVGALQLQQMTVKEECRGAFGTVEKSLCASASLLMYVGSAIASHSGSGQFWIMVWGSAMAVSTAAFISLTWLRSNAVENTSPRSGDYQKENLGST
jgi:iron-regulated transporter 1